MYVSTFIPQARRSAGWPREGLRYDINHPDLVLVGQRDLMIGHPSPENPQIYDRLVRVALVHVVGIEDLPATASPSAP